MNKDNFCEEMRQLIQGYYSMEDLIDDNEQLGIEFVEQIGSDEHRWFIVGDNVYKINLDGEDIYFGISEVVSLKSEMMTYEDTGCDLELFKVKPVIKKTFEVVYD